MPYNFLVTSVNIQHYKYQVKKEKLKLAEDKQTDSDEIRLRN